jgi:Lactate dehydrogenase and related dehydrogenases
MLERVDYLALTLPLTPETQGLMVPRSSGS